MSVPVSRHKHRPSISTLLRLDADVRGSEMHPGNPELQQHYDTFLDAVSLAKTGERGDVRNMVHHYRIYMKARDAQGGAL